MASPLDSDPFSETFNMTSQGATAINWVAEEEPAASQGVDLGLFSMAAEEEPAASQGATAINWAAEEEPAASQGYIGLFSMAAEEEPEASQGATAINWAAEEEPAASQGVDLHSAELNPLKTLQKPYAGMLFETLKEAGDYYEEYGRQQGFWTRIRSSYKTKQHSNEVTSRVYVCVHQGKHAPKEPSKSTENEDVINKRKRIGSTVKSGCPASFRATLDSFTLKWKVTAFNDEHNHKPVTPYKRMKMKSNRHMPTVVKDLTEAFHRENLRVSKLPSIFGGASLGFGKRDCYNHLRDVRHRELEMGDAQAVLTYFRKKQTQNHQFYYSMQCDDTGRATNFFWVDARSRTSYQYFGDVVAFDTTYRTNKYDMPFAPFTGVNHHSQSIQFGCALLQDETEESFLWLFETWLEAMGGNPPISIITDQDLAMKGAIAKIFPTSCHRLCLWHIKKKFVEKLSHVYYTKSTFKKAMKACLQHTYTEDDFEEQWKNMMTKYNLEGNEWLQQLYEICASWVPVYNRNIFFAGMNTTGRSEGINSFFDDFVTSTTTLKEFVLKYEQALKRIVERESDEDFESEHKSRLVSQGEFLLNHAAQIYTRTIFKKFKDEFDAVLMYKVEEWHHDIDHHSFKVVSKTGQYDHQFIVKLNMGTLAGTCGCKHFEFTGLICRHILKVFVRQDVDMIPEHFILARWRKQTNKFRDMDSSEPLRECVGEHADALRLNHMCQESTKLACSAASSNQRYLIFLESLKECSKKFDALSCTDDSVEVPAINPGDPEATNSSPLPHIMLLDPNISQTKGRKKEMKSKEGKKIAHESASSRLKSGIELNIGKKKRRCKCCHMLVRHDKRNCPQNTNRKKDIIDDEDGLDDIIA